MKHSIHFVSVFSPISQVSITLNNSPFPRLFLLAFPSRLVKFLYRNDTETEPVVLTVPGCATLCPLDKFEWLTKDLRPLGRTDKMRRKEGANLQKG